MEEPDHRCRFSRTFRRQVSRTPGVKGSFAHPLTSTALKCALLGLGVHSVQSSVGGAADAPLANGGGPHAHADRERGERSAAWMRPSWPMDGQRAGGVGGGAADGGWMRRRFRRRRFEGGAGRRRARRVGGSMDAASEARGGGCRRVRQHGCGGTLGRRCLRPAV